MGVGDDASLLAADAVGVLLGGGFESDASLAYLCGEAVEGHAGTQQVFGRRLGLQKDMADVDGVAPTLDELENVETVLGLDDGRHLAGLQGEGGGLKLAHHLATPEETQFAAFGCRPGVL